MPSLTPEQSHWLRIDIMGLVCDAHDAHASDPALAADIERGARALAIAEATFSQTTEEA